MNKVRNFLYVYTGLRSLTNAIKHWLGMNMLEAKFDRLHDEYADTIDEKVDEIVEDRSSDIQSNLEYELETQLSDGIDEKYSNSITDAVEEYADDVLPSLVAKSIDNTDVFTDVEDLLNRVNDIEATQEASIEQETEAEVVVLKADFETLQDKVEALEKFLEVLVDKQSWFLDEVENSSDSVKRIALLTNLDVSNALKELKGEK
tara:strand:+ start:3515 stop:4126 length:612 start_codon:yes stop_codon:yes gene_type:complete